nr:hypothetical protein [Actinospica robiniae]
MVGSLARALRLEPEEHEHLHRLATRAARRIPETSAAGSEVVRPGVEILVESLRPSPAYVLSRTLDVLPAGLVSELIAERSSPSSRAGCCSSA